MLRRPALTAIELSFIVVLNIIIWMILIAAIGLGAIRLNSCPVQPYIPVYLIVIGASSLVSLLLTYVKDSLTDGFLSILCSVCLPFLHLFNTCWFISGTVWVFSIHPPKYDSTDGCQRTLYFFAFGFNSLCWLAMGVVFICGGLCLIFHAVMGVKQRQIWKRRQLRPHSFSSNNRSYGADEETQTLRLV